MISSDLHLLSNQLAVFNSLSVRCVGYSWLDTISYDVIPVPSQVRKVLLESGSYYAHTPLNKPALILLQILTSLNFIHNSVNYFTGISLVGIQKWAARVQNEELLRISGRFSVESTRPNWIINPVNYKHSNKNKENLQYVPCSIKLYPYTFGSVQTLTNPHQNHSHKESNSKAKTFFSLLFFF